MPRKRRVWYPGAVYHVMNRGNRRVILYQDEDDYQSFIESIRMTTRLYEFKIHSLCLMTNHFHILIETADTELWKIMKRMLHPYAVNFNRKYNYTGHLFEDRYRACLVEDERYFLEASRYIHLNPVKAQMVKEPLAYEYSSYGKFVDGGCMNKKTSKQIEDLVDTSRILSCFDGERSEQYRMFVEGQISHTEHESLIQKDIGEDSLWLPF